MSSSLSAFAGFGRSVGRGKAGQDCRESQGGEQLDLHLRPSAQPGVYQIGEV
jgi:hypothetical protein